MERPGGGFAIQQGRSHLLVTNVEATALARVLNEMVQAPRLVIPAHE
ncbi:hypothetical protein MSG_01886 [Mycobacterium shigaense]|uniref:Uncharacterized protein n=1 Tax=Mycobacterium shigaense TaxID=722731 RepID=A0A1Z4EGE6_9MYCO|nr:hypothetical protein MSG_01886 [Mycobacterium shigaense]